MIMLDWIFKKRRNKKRRDAQEQELKRSLANKISKYVDSIDTKENDFTDLTINGKKMRIAKENITLFDP